MDANFLRNYLNQCLKARIENFTEVKAGEATHFVWSQQCKFPETKIKVDTGKEVLDVYIIRDNQDNNEIRLLTYIPEGAIG